MAIGIDSFKIRISLYHYHEKKAMADIQDQINQLTQANEHFEKPTVTDVWHDEYSDWKSKK